VAGLDSHETTKSPLSVFSRFGERERERERERHRDREREREREREKGEGSSPKNNTIIC